MTDIVSSETRRKMMAGIRGKNTGPEMVIRRALHSRGLRYRLHDTNLPGKPDLVFRKHKAVIQVHGCFWHGHRCHLFRWPATRADFWGAKILANRERDLRNSNELIQQGWRVLVVWECAIKGKYRQSFELMIDEIVEWLFVGSHSKEITGVDGNT